MSTKSELLKVLENNRGRHISGQKLAETLNISRTAIWKAINDLKKEGYPIEAVTNKGYTLSEESSILSAEAITQYLEEGTELSSIKVYKNLDSTNNEAKRLLIDDVPFNTVILAEEQSGGKGRRGKSFFSPPGDSIYVSFILKPLVDVSRSLLITVAASVAVSRAVEKFIGKTTNLYPQIKWVNDVYIDNKKICGILTEAVTDVENGQIQSLVLGIGINVNFDEEQIPEELKDIITSIRIPSGQRNKFVSTLINEIFQIQGQIPRNDSSEEPSFMEEYRQRSIILGKNIHIIKNDEKINARAVDIDSKGGLVVQYPSGLIDTLNTGEVSIRLDQKD